MANTGLSTFLHAERDDAASTYGVPEKLGGAIDIKEALDRNDAKLYADNELKDSDNSVTGGKITLTLDDDDDAVFAPVLGEEVEEINVGDKTYKKVISRTLDVPAGQGFGYITQKNGGRYKVTFYPKVKFVRGDEEAKTKEDKTEYTTPTVEGTIYPVEGQYKVKVTTETVEEAKKVLYSLFGYDESGEKINASGGTTQDPTLGA